MADGILGGLVDEYPELGQPITGAGTPEGPAPHWDDMINLVLGWGTLGAGVFMRRPMVQNIGLGWALYATAGVATRAFRRGGLATGYFKP